MDKSFEIRLDEKVWTPHAFSSFIAPWRQFLFLLAGFASWSGTCPATL